MTTQVYCPQGQYLHLLPVEPDSQWNQIAFTVPWWRDHEKYMIGNLTVKSRKIRLINMLTKHDDILEVNQSLSLINHFQVASEESINEILDRYLELNVHAASYTWKRLGRELNMDATLSDNDILDETDELIELGIDVDEYTPAIHLYFNDDLTIA